MATNFSNFSNLSTMNGKNNSGATLSPITATTLPSLSKNGFSNFSNLSTMNNGQTVGSQAKAPAQNITKPANTLPSNQVKTVSTAPAANAATPYSPNASQTTGLLAALARQKAGTATDADNKNLAYAQGKGWKAPVSPTSSTATTLTPAPKSATGLDPNEIGRASCRERV